jgi:Mrp family chromosome partitioning ATPase
MKILVTAGGKRTDKLLAGAAKTYAAGAVRLTGAQNLGEITSRVEKGEVFDRVVVIGNGLTHGLAGGSDDERGLRDALRAYAEAAGGRRDKITAVFALQTAELANMADEELFTLGSGVKILLKEDSKFSVDYLNTIFTAEIDNIESNFKPRQTAEIDEISEEYAGYEGIDPDVFLNGENQGLFGAPQSVSQAEPDGQDTGDEGESAEYSPSPDLFDDSFYQEAASEEPSPPIDLKNPPDSIDSIDTYSASEVETLASKAALSEPPKNMEKTVINSKGKILGGLKNRVKSPQKRGEQPAQEQTPRGESPRKQPPPRQKPPKSSEGGFSDNMYASQRNTDATEKLTSDELNLLKESLAKLSSGSKVFLFAGVAGAGASTMAYNAANTIAALGFDVLLADLDTASRTQSYMNKYSYDAVHNDENRASSLLQAINNPMRILDYVSVVDAGLHLISCALTENTTDLAKKVEKTKMLKFVNLVKQSYNFIIFDVPQDILVHFAGELLYSGDYVVFTLPANTRGFMRTLLYYGGIEDEETQEVMFSKSKFIINQCAGEKINIFGKESSKISEITRQMDVMSKNLTGRDCELLFSNIPIAGVVPYLPQMDDFWLKSKSFSDTELGQDIFLRLLSNILKKEGRR